MRCGLALLLVGSRDNVRELLEDSEIGAHGTWSVGQGFPTKVVGCTLHAAGCMRVRMRVRARMCVAGRIRQAIDAFLAEDKSGIRPLGGR